MASFVVRFARDGDLGAVARDGDFRGGDLGTARGDLGAARAERGDLGALRVGLDLERERSSKFPP